MRRRFAADLIAHTPRMEKLLPVVLQHAPAAVLALLAGLVVGYFNARVWLPQGRSSKTVRAGSAVFSLVTYSGPVLLEKWKSSPDPVSGSFWILGIIASSAVVLHRELNSLVTSIQEQSDGVEESRIRRFVKTRLWRVGSAEAEKEALAWLAKEKATSDEAKRALARVHNFIHAVRDKAVSEFATLEMDVQTLFTTGEASLRGSFARYLSSVAEQYVSLLAVITGQSDGLWVWS